MNQRCDLHVHSTYSDGTCTPEELILRARTLRVSAIALTDHNTLDGLPDFLAAAEKHGILGVPGIEISSEWEGRELHILALFVKPDRFGDVRQLLEEYNIRKEQSNLDLIDALEKAGMPLDYERIRHLGHINRANIAAQMLEKGYVTGIQDAFRRFLAPERGFYTPPRRLSSFEVIRFIRSIGAVPVLAHPLLSLKEEELRAFLLQERGCGLEAMETIYSTYDAHTTALARQIAREFSLKESGGSDFHGINKPDIELGTGRGNLVIPRILLDNLTPNNSVFSENTQNKM